MFQSAGQQQKKKREEKKIMRRDKTERKFQRYSDSPKIRNVRKILRNEQ